ncbi:MAG: M23 family metallopeptidase [Acidimicrobiia bacterium]|nr:M23 family metallopeptidase [Acidimicrobiia bacterium]
MKRAIGALGTALLIVLTAAPAPAITEDDLRDLRLEWEGAQGELETATWEQRIAADTRGLIQFEYDELAGEAAVAVAARTGAVEAAVDRSLVLFTGTSRGIWSESAIERRYLEAGLAADQARIAAREETVAGLEADLAFLADEIELFAAAEAEATLRVDELTGRVAVLEADYLALAQAYEAELQAAATSTTTTTTTTPAPTTTTTAPVTTTTLGPPATTTTTVTTVPVGATTTTTVPASTTTTVQPPTTTTTTVPLPAGDLVCPVQGPHHFRDTWGAPRSGGRTHKGVDMMADRGTPLVAIEDGTVGRLADGGLGGITVWLLGDSGAEYYYAHLDGWAPGLAQGQRVERGAPLGTVGSTGNAPDAWPHLHFEIHPDGGEAVNPFPTVDAICP